MLHVENPPPLAVNDSPTATRGQASADAPSWRTSLNSCLLSLGLHLGLFVMLGLTLRATARGLPGDEPARPASIVVVQTSGNKVEYFSEPNVSQGTALVANASATGPLTALPRPSALPGANEAPLNIAALLPPTTFASPLEAGQAALGNANELTSSKAASGGAIGSATPAVRTQLFGIAAEGKKFVYVFDRSTSMTSHEGRPLAAAKRELRDSLRYLKSVHQFQIIFYNDRPHPFNPNAPLPPRMLFADEANLAAADRYVENITANGNTQHYGALLFSLGLGPDVIFFLTDADEPTLSQAELAEIRNRNESLGITIHAIEFGYGPPRPGGNFLKTLAADNQGQHAYVDISRLPRP